VVISDAFVSEKEPQKEGKTREEDREIAIIPAVSFINSCLRLFRILNRILFMQFIKNIERALSASPNVSSRVPLAKAFLQENHTIFYFFPETINIMS
jgi:hypothetical protein